MLGDDSIRARGGRAQGPVALGVGCLLALGLLAAELASAERLDQPAAEVRQYWTEQRMRAAEPVELPTADRRAVPRRGAPTGRPSFVPEVAPGEAAGAALRKGVATAAAAIPVPDQGSRKRVTNPSAEPLRAHGKVFFKIRGGSEPGDYVCSGTSVNSKTMNLVWSAGHCVFDTFGGGYAKKWIFVPAYEDGKRPFGRWVAKRLKAPVQWRKRGSLRQDVGAAIVSRNKAGDRLAEVVGGRGIGFNQPRKRTYSAFGYPAQPPFDGEYEYRCNSPLRGSDTRAPGKGPPPMRIACDMNGGSSGGSWIARGIVHSVNSYKYILRNDQIYGPYLSRPAKKLYRQASNPPKPKNKRNRRR